MNYAKLLIQMRRLEDATRNRDRLLAEIRLSTDKQVVSRKNRHLRMVERALEVASAELQEARNAYEDGHEQKVDSVQWKTPPWYKILSVGKSTPARKTPSKAWEDWLAENRLDGLPEAEIQHACKRLCARMIVGQRKKTVETVSPLEYNSDPRGEGDETRVWRTALPADYVQGCTPDEQRQLRDAHETFWVCRLEGLPIPEVQVSSSPDEEDEDDFEMPDVNPSLRGETNEEE